MSTPAQKAAAGAGEWTDELLDSWGIDGTGARKLLCERHNAAMRAHAKDAEREFNLDEIDEMERYDRADGRRDWAKHASTWLYPGDMICIISGETAKRIDAARTASGGEEKPKPSPQVFTQPNPYPQGKP